MFSSGVMTAVSRTRHVLVVVAVAAVLCADQVSVASQSVRQESVGVTRIASRLVDRLTRNLRRVMPVAIHQPARQLRTADSAFPVFADLTPHPTVHATLSPFQFRLPPPLI